MSFLNPFFFIALGAALIPVIIHLISFRKPNEVAFSTLAFFRQLQKTTVRRLQIKRYLLLVCRALAVILLALALARPFLPSQITGRMGSPEQEQFVGILLDNGPSMMQVDEFGPYMDQAKNAIREIINQASESSRFMIVPSHGDRVAGRLMRKSEAHRYLEEMETVNKGAFPAERMLYLSEQLQQEPGMKGSIYWITDARKTQLERMNKTLTQEAWGQDGPPVTMIRVGSDDFQNIAVVSVNLQDRVMGAGIPFGVSVEVKNFGNQPVFNSFLSLEVEGERLGQYEVDLQAGEKKELLFEVIPASTGSLAGRALLEGGTYTFDHIRYFSMQIPETRKVLLVHDRGEDGTRPSNILPVLSAIAGTGSRISSSSTDISSVREYDLDDFDAIILEGVRQVPDYLQAELVQFVQRGRGLLFIPSEQGVPDQYNHLFRLFNAGEYVGMRGSYGRFQHVASLQPFAHGHRLFDDVFETAEDEEIRIDLPSIYYYWRYQSSAASPGVGVLGTDLGEPLFVEHTFGDGMLLIGMMGLSPGWSNISIKPVYAPLLYRMLLYVVNWEHGGVREHLLGSSFDRAVELSGRDIKISLNGDEMRPEFISETGDIRIRYPATEWSPGWLELSSEKKKHVIAVNQDISESDFTSLSTSEARFFLRELFPVFAALDLSGYTGQEVRSALASASFGKEIWSWFIWMALFFLSVESIISRAYKTESIAD